MKNSAKYLIGALIIGVGVVGVTFYSCEKEEIVPNEYTPTADAQELDQDMQNTMKMDEVDLCGEAATQAILDPEGNQVGKSFAYNDAEFFYLELIAQKGYKIRDVQMEVVQDPKKIPLNENGNPDFKSFRYTIQAERDEPRRVLQVPISQLSGNSVVTATMEYAKVSDKEPRIMRVWVDGKAYGSAMSGRMFNYEKGVCLVDEGTQDLADE